VNKYTVEVKPSAAKELEALPDNVLSRVVYIIDDTAKVVSVTRIAHRSDVYEHAS
jgi:mRNA-degrading endonuclease RelE of RelBE toxin-antitoxin system